MLLQYLILQESVLTTYIPTAINYPPSALFPQSILPISTVQCEDTVHDTFETYGTFSNKDRKLNKART